MSDATCVDCGTHFHQKEQWAIRCYSCWKQRKEAIEAAKAREDDMREQIKQAHADYMREQAEQARADYARAQARESTAAVANADWPKMLMRLIRLCHPDRHGNSQESNDITRWLLEQRDALRKPRNAPISFDV